MAGVALPTGNGPAFTGLSLLVIANIGAFTLVGVASLMAAMGQERAAYLQQAEALKRIEATRSHGERLESLGRMAAGIAHDFNNVLTVIHSSALLSGMEATAGEREIHLADVESATARATDLTRQLLAFARQQTREPQRLDLRTRLESMASLLRRLAGPSVSIETVASGGPACTVQMDPSQFDQIVFNLVTNARDAMPRGGKLTITSGIDEDPTPRHVAGSTLPAGRYARLAFEDTGEGIPPEVVNHIFEPFFTTKQAERGTGLGLSTVYGIVRQSHGDISVSSTPGRGTRFEILLPLSA